jgi:hypothetical protein
MVMFHKMWNKNHNQLVDHKSFQLVGPIALHGKEY